jgi:acetyl esterase/lipase
MLDAGVMTDVHVVPGAYHGVDVTAPDTQVARRFTASKIEALRNGLA